MRRAQGHNSKKRLPARGQIERSIFGEEIVETARVLIQIVEIYGWIGLAVAGAFLLFGIERVDAGARRAYAFRPLLIPGCIVLWPLVLARWAAAERRRMQ